MKSTIGLALTTTAMILAFSPQARQSLRSWMVKGTAAVLDASDNVKEQASGFARQLQSFRDQRMSGDV